MDLITTKSHRPALPSLSTAATEEDIPPEMTPPPPLSTTAETAPTATDDSDDDPPLRIFVFDAQRTSAQLFNRQLLSHLRFASISNPYALAATLGAERIHPKLHNNARAKEAWEEQVASASPRITSLTYQQATENFLREADRLESKGKLLFVREHAPLVMKHDLILSAIRSKETVIPKLFNPTLLPDELLKVVTPIIFIKHPARVIPSWLREANSTADYYQVDDDDLTLWTSARWSRMIFDYLRSTSPSSRPPSRQQRNRRSDSVLGSRPAGSQIVACYPIVIDAADVMNNTHAILATLCRLLDLDVDDSRETWGATQKLQRAYEFLAKTVTENLFKAFSDRVKSAEGYGGNHRATKLPSQPPSDPPIDLDAEERAWRKEFGPSTARALRFKVEEELPHYHYLRSFKLRPRPAVPSTSEATFRQNVFGAPLENIRSSIDASSSSEFWMGEGGGGGNGWGRRGSQRALSEMCRSASMSQMPVGIFG